MSLSDTSHHCKTLEHHEYFLEQFLGNVVLIEHAFTFNVTKFKVLSLNVFELDFDEFLEKRKQIITKIVKFKLRDLLNIKFQVQVIAIYSKPFNPDLDYDDDEEPIAINHQTKFEILSSASNFNDVFDALKVDIVAKSFTFFTEGSGLSLDNIKNVVLSIIKYNPIHGSSYIELPQMIKNKHCIINVRNTDDLCFIYSVLVKRYEPVHRKYNHNHYARYLHKLCYTSLSFPMDPSDIHLFERLNKKYSINVFKLLIKGNDYKVELLRVTREVKLYHVNLLLIRKGRKYHYTYIKNLATLLNNQMGSQGNRLFLCDSCLCRFRNAQVLRDHILRKNCLFKEVILPLPKTFLEFSNFDRTLPALFSIFADIECLLQKITNVSILTTTKTYPTHLHIPCSFAYKIKCHQSVLNHQELDDVRLYRDINPMHRLIESLITDVTIIFDKYLPINDPLVMTPDDIVKYRNSKICHICGKPFKRPDGKITGKSKCRDHNHQNGVFRGAAHVICNTRYQAHKFVPIYFHNLNYDTSCFIKELSEFPGNISVLPINKERYISFSFKFQVQNYPSGRKRFAEIRFLDSFRFLPFSLESLANTLHVDQFKNLMEEFPNPLDSNLLKRKGVYPYTWFSDESKFTITLFPEIGDFYNDLTKSDISREDYDHGLNVFQHFQCANMGSYSDLYLKTDVLLLVDIFENFRTMVKEYYGLEVASYYTTPSLSFDAMLKMTQVRLELLSDIEIIDFINQGIRGGIVGCVSHEAIANNKYMRNFDKTKPSIFLNYFDCNNLYGTGMIEPLGYDTFGFIQACDIQSEYTKALTALPTSNVGFILEVDIEKVEDSLHDIQNDLPFNPVMKAAPSPYGKHEKLMLDFSSKKKYIIHYRNLQLIVKHGLKISKIHRILKFRQKPFLKIYVDFNTRKRANATSELARLFHKLMVNAVYGKCLEDEKHRKKIHLITEWSARHSKKLTAEKLVSKPNFHSLSTFTNEFVAIEMNALKIKLIKPRYLGFSILEISKLIIYKFWYEFLVPTLKDYDLKLLYYDTDAVLFSTHVEDIWDIFRPYISQYFDTSNMSPAHLSQFNIQKCNGQQLGMWKDECKGFTLEHLVALAAKMYALKIATQNGEKVKACAKGVSKSVVKSYSLQPYLNALNGEPQVSVQSRIHSKLHVLKTIVEQKLALSLHDDKRFQIPESLNTLAWYHKDIQNKYDVRLE